MQNATYDILKEGTMIILKDYATKTEIVERSNKTVSGFWPIGIDYGFSGVKGFEIGRASCRERV